jgi:hypothetical protein
MPMQLLLQLVSEHYKTAVSSEVSVFESCCCSREGQSALCTGSVYTCTVASGRWLEQCKLCVKLGETLQM